MTASESTHTSDSQESFADRSHPSQYHVKTANNNSSGVTQFSVPSLFFVYEGIITGLSLFFLGVAIIFELGTKQLIAVSSPFVVVFSIVVVSAVKIGIGVGLARHNWRAWLAAIITIPISFAATVFQLTGLFTETFIWGFLVRTESGGNLGVILSVIFGDGLHIPTAIVLTACLYATIFYRLFTSRPDLASQQS